MVARIRSGKSLKGAMNYNEKKVNEGKAEMILVKGYPKAAHQLNFHEKLNRLQKLADLNTRTSTNCLHLSLNFDPSENLSKENLQKIAEAYMLGIGFGNQPYLVYHHHDAAHQHIHIVTTNIQKNGKRISLHNLGRESSEKTRKEIEVNFDLVKAGEKQQTKLHPLKAVNLEKALYGKVETKRAITNIVNQVINQYKFTSLPGFNAALQRFGVTADRGPEGTRVFEKRGLQYSLLDEKLNKVGVPIKASSIYNKPTLKLIESKFDDNRQARLPFKIEAKNRITKALFKSYSKEEFSKALKQNDIDIIWRMNDQNFLYGVTYVDHKLKTVFNGNELGKELSAAALRARWTGGTQERKPAGMVAPVSAFSIQVENNQPPSNFNNHDNMIDILIDPKPLFDHVPYALKRKRKKRKGKNLL